MHTEPGLNKRWHPRHHEGAQHPAPTYKGSSAADRLGPSCLVWSSQLHDQYTDILMTQHTIISSDDEYNSNHYRTSTPHQGRCMREGSLPSSTIRNWSSLRDRINCPWSCFRPRTSVVSHHYTCVHIRTGRCNKNRIQKNTMINCPPSSFHLQITDT